VADLISRSGAVLKLFWVDTTDLGIGVLVSIEQGLVRMCRANGHEWARFVASAVGGVLPARRPAAFRENAKRGDRSGKEGAMLSWPGLGVGKGGGGARRRMGGVSLRPGDDLGSYGSQRERY